MTDPIIRLLRGVLESENDVTPSTALYGSGATEEQQAHADRVARAAHGRGLIVDTGGHAIGEDLLRVGVTAAGRQYLAEHDPG